MTKNLTDKKIGTITRRDFIRGATFAALGAALPLPLLADDAKPVAKTRVALVRNPNVFDKEGGIDPKVISKMMDDALTALFEAEKPIDVWKGLFKPDDVVGIKSNEWGPLPTPEALEEYFRLSLLQVGVDEKNIDIDDRGVLRSRVFKGSTALINARPMRTHHWSGVGSLLKNYIMFTPSPPSYHDNYCADLAKLWDLPMVQGKTRLNVLVMLTPLFHGVGSHHFDPEYTWKYGGLLVGTDPVALDSVGLQILQAKRLAYFGENKPLRPTAHHIRLADTRHGLGVSDLDKIELTKIGSIEDALI
ncbi:MAG: DUF362 domain-containing protein [Candidatus Zixiibacteriota bacterium]